MTDIKSLTINQSESTFNIFFIKVEVSTSRNNIKICIFQLSFILVLILDTRLTKTVRINFIEKPFFTLLPHHSKNESNDV